MTDLYKGKNHKQGYVREHIKKRKAIPLTFLTCFAEDEGFKPPIPGKGYTGFRVQRIRSLCQSSLATFHYSICKSTEILWNVKSYSKESLSRRDLSISASLWRMDKVI